MALVILKAGDKIASLADVAGDYEDWIAAGMGMTPDAVIVVPVHRGATPPPWPKVTAVAVTGSGAMVGDPVPWIADARDWLREAVERRVPVLGICFGHQLLAAALGGDTGPNRAGIEVGTVEIELTSEGRRDPLFKGVPNRFPAHASHQQSVTSLPAGARLLARSTMTGVQAFAYDTHAWGVQFHPDFDVRICRGFVEYFQPTLEAEGAEPDDLLRRCCPTPANNGLLHRFAELAFSRPVETDS